jgi:hypothetical protein
MILAPDWIAESRGAANGTVAGVITHQTRVGELNV